MRVLRKRTNAASANTWKGNGSKVRFENIPNLIALARLPHAIC